MTTLSHVYPDVQLGQALNRLRGWADNFIAGLAEVPDEHIVEIARGAGEMETQGFRIRGACAAEMKRRVRARALGDEQRIGEAMAEMARDAGVNFHTLKDDCRIYETFGEQCLSTNIYPREVYRLALTAREPHSAVEMYAGRKAEDQSYSTLDFRRDVSELNRGRTTPEERAPDLHRLYFDLPAEAIAALNAICRRDSISDEEAIKRALVAYAEREGRG
jgi:hypothetical protein